MADNKFDVWFNGAPVLQTAATGDFSLWKDGAPVLQLQLSATVEIVGSGGVEVGGAAIIEIVVHGQVPPSPGIGVRTLSVPRRRRRRHVQREIVGAGGVEVGGAAGLAVVVHQPGSGGVEVGGAADQQVVEPGAEWLNRLLREDEELLLMDVL